jgi:16S rRNA C1402 (ribose-2'-O) methylase RsmI
LCFKRIIQTTRRKPKRNSKEVLAHFEKQSRGEIVVVVAGKTIVKEAKKSKSKRGRIKNEQSKGDYNRRWTIRFNARYPFKQKGIQCLSSEPMTISGRNTITELVA